MFIIIRGTHILFVQPSRGDNDCCVRLAPYVTNVPLAFGICGRWVGCFMKVLLPPGFCTACFLKGVPVGPLFFTFESGYSCIMSFMVRWGSGMRKMAVAVGLTQAIEGMKMAKARTLPTPLISIDIAC